MNTQTSTVTQYKSTIGGNFANCAVWYTMVLKVLTISFFSQKNKTRDQ